MRIDKGLLRGVTPGKLVRDAEHVRTYARFVIVVKNGTVRIIDNVELHRKNLPYARIIAVLGAVHHNGGDIEESVLMEIGYRRSRPYAQLEEKSRDGNGHGSIKRWHLKSRYRVRHLSDEELALVFPAILSCIRQIVFELRETWGHKGVWWTEIRGLIPGENRVKPFERGIHFTVSRSDITLHDHLLRADMQLRWEKYIKRHARWTFRYLRGYRCSFYTPKRLRSCSRALKVGQILSQGHYTPLYRAALVRHFKEGTQRRTVLDMIISAFEINIGLTPEEERLFSSPRLLPSLDGLRCYRPPSQPSVHAKNATVFEIIPEGDVYGKDNPV